MNYDELLQRAKWGAGLTREELNHVASQLTSQSPKANRYTLLHILGAGGDEQYRQLIESFLNYKDDTMLAKLALQILCGFWGDTDRYRDYVLKFLKGVEWDDDDDCRLIAISAAGEYLRKTADPDLLRELLRIFYDEEDWPSVREGAYSALARAVGMEWGDLPSAANKMDFYKDVDSTVLEKAAKRLSTTG